MSRTRIEKPLDIHQGELVDQTLSFFRGLIWLSIGTWLVFPLWLFMQANPTPSTLIGVLKTEVAMFLPGLFGLIASIIAYRRVPLTTANSVHDSMAPGFLARVPVATMFGIASLGKLVMLWLLVGPIEGVTLGNGVWIWVTLGWLLPTAIFLQSRERPPSSLPSALVGILMAVHVTIAYSLSGSGPMQAALVATPFLMVLFIVEVGFLGGTLRAMFAVLSPCLTAGPLEESATERAEGS